MGFRKRLQRHQGLSLDPVTVAKIHVLGSGYEKELIAQVPKENLPKRFGGDCQCPGGCEFSDMGPWQEKEWYRTPKWAKQSSGGGAAATQAAPAQVAQPGQAATPAPTGAPMQGSMQQPMHHA